MRAEAFFNTAEDGRMISLALPKGSSLEQRTLDLFRAAHLPVRRQSEHSYRATIEYDGPMPAVFYKPREIPSVVEQGLFDLGLTGADWVEESGAKIEVVRSFGYSKATNRPWRVVLTVPEEHPARTVADLSPGLRVATEYVAISRDYFAHIGLPVTIVRSYGATEAKIPELADAVIDVVETGSSLRHNGLRILETIRTCDAQLIVNPTAWLHPAKRERILTIAHLLTAAHAGPAHTLLTVQVAPRHLAAVTAAMPDRSWRLGSGLGNEQVVVLQGTAPTDSVVRTIAALASGGALQIMESAVGSLMSLGDDDECGGAQ
jgi:ATP phosphoribosyltransferase